MEFEGVVFKMLPPVSGTGARGPWTKQEVVFEMPGEFNRKVCVSFWGDKAEDAKKLREGDKAEVSVNIESREYNGRWFTEVRAWKFNVAAPTAPQPEAGLPPLEAFPEEEPVNDLPF